MSIFGELFKRIIASNEQSNTEENNLEEINNNNIINNIQIQIDGDTGLFKDEKQQIVAGAKQLLEMGKCDDMVDAIITFATMFRGLKFLEIKKLKNGEIVVVLQETAQELKGSINRDEKNEGR